MLQVIDRMANNLWSNLDIPDVWGNSSKYRGLTIRLIVYKLIINIILERIRLRHNYPKNRMDLERTVVQQMEHIQ